jgi:ribosomal-protein-alanine N-acetyltransferase
MNPMSVAPLDTKNVSLLWASPERADDIANLHARLFDPAWDAESITRMIENPASASFVAQIRDPRALAGFVLGQIAADEAEVLSIGVAPEWQRRGLARHMMEGLVRAARRAEVKRVFLEVAADNAGAIGLYNSLGFKVAGGRKAYYQRAGGQTVDAAVLSLAI